MTQTVIDGCFYLDSCVVLSEILGQNKNRMTKMKKDIKKHNITCYVSPSVVTECNNKIEKTLNFLEFIFKKVIIVCLEGISTKPRDLDKTKVSNQDLHRIREAFLLIDETTRDYDLFKDPFQVIEEWFVQKLDKAVQKTKKTIISNFIIELTGIILSEITKMKSDFESLVELETQYISNSNLLPNRWTVNLLIRKQIHTADAVHISVIRTHQNTFNNKAIFLTFDYASILRNWNQISKDSRIANIKCADPIYGLSFLR